MDTPKALHLSKNKVYYYISEVYFYPNSSLTSTVLASERESKSIYVEAGLHLDSPYCIPSGGMTVSDALIRVLKLATF